MNGDGAILSSVRALIAGRVLAPETDEPPLGDVFLRPDQLDALARLRVLLALHRGALLAEGAGVGKTYVAVAVARRYERVVVVAPASLRTMWEAALRRASVSARFHSFERLSRARSTPDEEADLVVVDEAHHVRTPSTNRYAAVAALCDGAAVLLLSATPVQNRREDLSAQLALFLGDVAWTMDDEELAGFVVRHRSDGAGDLLPAVQSPRWIQLPCEDDILELIAGLPPSVAGSDEGDGGALVTYGLLRQWASSRAALVESLRRRIARAVALSAALESGRWPTRRELAAWTYADGAMQLAFPELMASGDSVASADDLLPTVRRHEAALIDLLAVVKRQRDPDEARAEALRAIRARHRDSRIIAFSEYRATVRALAQRLLPDGGIAELTATSARVAGGRVTRREVLAQLAPNAPRRGLGERIDLLVTTDVLSEGLDLHGASVVVHLDLPWNPARLEQRLGRVRRIGSAHKIVWTYALAPPASSERVLRIEDRLRRKLQVAGRIAGESICVLPVTGGHGAGSPGEIETSSAAEAASKTLGMLAAWCEPSASTPRLVVANDRLRPFALAAACSPCDGFVALLVDANAPLLVVDVGHGPTLDAHVVERAVRLMSGNALPASADEATETVALIAAWWAKRRGSRSLGIHSGAGARLRAQLSSSIDAILARTPRHERARVALLASRARQALRVTLPAASERALATLVSVTPVDESRLSSLAEIADRHASAAQGASATGGDLLEPAASGGEAMLPLVALVLLRRGPLEQR